MSMLDDQQIPEAVRKSIKAMRLKQLKGTPTLDIYELELFDWYAKETEELLNRMLSAGRSYIQEQLNTEAEEINDSGMVAVDYYLKRIRYSHVIYLTSLLETCLERACDTLTKAVGKQNLSFEVTELRGDQWVHEAEVSRKVWRFEIPEEMWSAIQVLISIRNNLVHDNGDTNTLKANEKIAIAKWPGIKLNGNEVVIEPPLVGHAFEAMKSLTSFVEDRLAEVIDRAIGPKGTA